MLGIDEMYIPAYLSQPLREDETTDQVSSPVSRNVKVPERAAEAQPNDSPQAVRTQANSSLDDHSGNSQKIGRPSQLRLETFVGGNACENIDLCKISHVVVCIRLH